MNALVSKMNEARQKSRFWNSRNPEYLILLVFFILYCTISAFHEPWFDEAQSWQIAKCESIGRLLFYIPHYEGNPPLWYLILAIPAKLGIPFELGLKTVGLLISLCYVSLLVLKSPFPRAVRLILPFTYFLFYQYGIIVRPYGMMIVAFILVAMAFKERNSKPLRFVLCLAFLCETSSFCVLIAGGIAACWLLEIIKEKPQIKNLTKDARIFALFVLFVFAVVLVVTVLPASDASFTSKLEGNNSVIKCFLISITTVLSEALMLTSPWFSNDQSTLATANITAGALIPCVVVQLIMLIFICCFSSKRKLKYFFIPYLCYCLFGSVVVLAGHYIGIVFCLLIFWLWITVSENQSFEIGKLIRLKLHISDQDTALLRKFAIVFCTLSMIISLSWTISSAWKEVDYQYSYGRETARFLEDNGLTNSKIAMTWHEEFDELNNLDYEEVDLKSNGWPVALCAYEGRNVVYNFNNGLDEAAYVQFIKQTAEENKKAIEQWKKYGPPDVLIGQVDVELLTDAAVSIRDYSPVYEMEINYIWKGNLYQSMQYLFVRNEFLDKYSLTPIDRLDGIYGNFDFVITDEMRERYENGEDINEILKPYLDYIFGEQSGDLIVGNMENERNN